MRVTKERAAENRERILTEAARACFGSVAYLRWAWMPWLRLLG
jgi:hypothetical protein